MSIHEQSPGDFIIPPSYPKTELDRHIFTRDEIAESLVRQRKGVELHRHVEGVLNGGELRVIADQLGITLDEEIWTNLAQVMNDTNQEPNLQNFINKLSTRWMRLILIKGILDHEVDYRVTLGAFFDRILEKAYNEGIETLELLASPLNMSYDGNLFWIVPPKGATQAELDIINRWHTYLSDKRFDNAKRRELPRIEGYCETFKHCVTKKENAERYCWGGTKTALEDKRMEVGLRFCFRREEWAEGSLKNDPQSRHEVMNPQGLALARRIKHLHDNGYIVACDIAGLEHAESHPLSDYSALLRYFNTNDILFTVHVGEIAADGDLERARHNFETVLRFKKNLIRLGHAVRVFDHNNRDILRQLVAAGIGLEGNSTSNIATEVVELLSQQPYYAAYRGEHPDQILDPEFDQQLLPLLGFYTDDPVIIGAENPLAHELWLAAFHTHNFGYQQSVDEMIDSLWRNQRQMAAWNIRKARQAR